MKKESPMCNLGARHLRPGEQVVAPTVPAPSLVVLSISSLFFSEDPTMLDSNNSQVQECRPEE